MASAMALVGKGERLARAGDWAAAERCFTEAHRLRPKDARIVVRQAAAFEAQSPVAALNAALRAAEASPNSAIAHIFVARFALAADRPKPAARAAGRALELDRDNGLARSVLALAQSDQGKWEETLDLILEHGLFEEWSISAHALLRLERRWTELGPVYPPAPHGLEIPTPDAKPASEHSGSARGLMSAIRSAYSRGDGGEMLRLLGPMRAADPESTEAPAGYAAALSLCGRDDLAEPWIKHALRVQAKESRRQWQASVNKPLARLGRKLRRKPDPDMPKEIDEAEPEALVLAGRVHLGLGDLTKAARYIERGSRLINPFDRWEARLIQAAIHDRQSDVVSALGELRLAIAEEPSVLPVALQRVTLHGAMSAAREAVIEAEKAGDEVRARALRAALCRVHAGPLPTARLRKARRLESEDPIAPLLVATGLRRPTGP